MFKKLEKDINNKKWFNKIILKETLFKFSGFTLVELLLYMGLFTIIMVVLTNIFTLILDLQIGSQTTSNVAQDGRFIYSRLIYDINSADSVQQPATLGSTSSTLTLTKSGVQSSYSISNNNLVLTDASGSSALNSYGTNISNLSFQRIGNINGKHTFKILFTISSNAAADHSPEVRNFQTTAGLR